MLRIAFRADVDSAVPMKFHRLLLILGLCWTAWASGLDTSAWTKPFPPHRIAGNLYYVGSQDLASYLVATPEGHMSSWATGTTRPSPPTASRPSAR